MDDRAQLTKMVRQNKLAKTELLQVIKEQEKYLRAENEEYKRTNSTVNLLSQTFRKMNKEQSAANKDLAGDIDTLRNSLKDADASIGNFQRNVGNYPKIVSQITGSIPGLNGVASAFNGIASAANPVIGIVSAIVTVIKTLTSAIDSYDEAIAGSAQLTYDMNDAMTESEAKSIAMTRHLQNNADAWIEIKSAVSSAWQEVKNFFGFYTPEWIAQWGMLLTGDIKGFFNSFSEIDEKRKKMKADEEDLKQIISEQKALIKERDAKELAFTTRKIELEAEIAKQRRIATEEENYSATERQQAQKKAIELTRELYADEREIAQLNADIMELEGKKSANSVEVSKKIAEAQSKVTDLTRQEDAAVRTLLRSYNSLGREATRDVNKLATALQNAQNLVDKWDTDDNSFTKQLGKAEREYEKARAALVEHHQDTTELDNAYLAQRADIYAKWRDSEITKASKAMKAQGASIIREFVNAAKEIDKEVKNISLAPATFWEKLFGGSTKEEKKKAKAMGQQIVNEMLQMAQQLYSELERMAQESIHRRLDDELDALDRETDSKKAALKKQSDDGVISQKAYERRLEEIDKEAEARQEELKKKAFEKEKKLNLITAAMNGAMAITSIWAKHGANPVYAGMLSAISAAMMAAQIVIISAQKYARGGLLQGASHAQGGIKGSVQGNNIELEGGEVVINKRSAAMFRRELSAINSYNGWGQKFAEGGELPKRFKFAEGGRLPSFAPAPLPTNADNGIASMMNAINKRNDNLERAISAIERQVVNIRAHVVYDDIESTGNDIRLSVKRAAL